MSEDYVPYEMYRADLADFRADMARFREDVRGDLAQTDARLTRVEATVDGMREQLRSVDARLLSLENWMRMFMVTLSTVAVGIAVQIVLTIVKG